MQSSPVVKKALGDRLPDHSTGNPTQFLNALTLVRATVDDMAVDTMPSKLEYADVFGATHRVHAAETDPVLAVRELTQGRGADYAFEAIGLTETSVQALQCTRRGGKAIIVGVIRHGAQLTIDPDFLHQDRQLLGCTYGSANMRAGMPQLVDLYRARKLKLDELVSRTYHLEDINTAFAALEQGEVARSIIAYP